MSTLFTYLRILTHALPDIPEITALLAGLAALGAGLVLGRVRRRAVARHPGLRRLSLHRALQRLPRSPDPTRKNPREGPSPRGS